MWAATWRGEEGVGDVSFRGRKLKNDADLDGVVDRRTAERRAPEGGGSNLRPVHLGSRE